MKLKTAVVEQKIILQALPDEVYDALLNPRRHSEFTGSKATGKARVGEEFTGRDGYISGKNLELERGKRIVQEWVTSDWPEGYPPSRLEFKLREVDGKTELTMLHSNIPAQQEEELEQSWIDYYWEPLKNYFEKRKKVCEAIGATQGSDQGLQITYRIRIIMKKETSKPLLSLRRMNKSQRL
jgi:activator of HSP90 ATPase